MVGQSSIHEKTFSLNSDERADALHQLITSFESFPDRQHALEYILRFCSDEDQTLRIKAVNGLGAVFPKLSDEEKEKCWNSLLEFIRTEEAEVWKAVVLSIVFSFGHVPEKAKAWNCLLRLAEDESKDVREHAVEALILLFPSMPDREKVWTDFIALAGSGYREVRELASDAFILIYPCLKDRENVWKSLLKLAESGDSHVRDRAGDVMARIFHQLPDQKKAMQDVDKLTMNQMDYITRRAVRSLRDDYPEISEAGNPAEELYRLAAKKGLYARWKSPSTAEKGQWTSSKKEKGKTEK